MLQKYLMRVCPGVLTSVSVLVILWLTLAPHPLPENDIPLFEHADKVVHLLMFGALVFAMVIDRELYCQRRYEQTRRLPRRPRGMMVAFVMAATLFGGLIEILQGWMGLGRGCDPLDLLADFAGALLSAAVSPWLASLLLRSR